MITTMNDSVEKQNAYVRRLKEQGFDFGLVVAEAFVSSMRNLGYKNTGTAIDELIDNSIEAGADNIHVVFGYDGGNESEKKPQRIIVIDDGHGMSEDMLRVAVLWGGGHRTDSRELFGRFGFGLPSASVSQGRRFELYSRTSSAGWYSIAVDIDEIIAGTFYKENNHLAAPPAKSVRLPKWIQGILAENFGDKDINHGTIVVIEKLDQLSWKTTATLERKLLEHFGVTYRNWLRKANLFVNGKKVEPVDPLFLDPTARFYNESDLRAEAIPETELEVKDRDTGNILGVVKIRYSYLPPGFQNKDMTPGDRKDSLNKRFDVMKDNNGFLVLRAGRQIDVVTHNDWITFINYDRNWKVEIDFPPKLDEFFSITTSKQQVVISERMWTLLEQAGVKRAVAALRKRYRAELVSVKQKKEDPREGKPRSSEEVMAGSTKYKTRKAEPSPEQREERVKQFQRKVEERARQTGKPKEEVEREVEAEVLSSPYKLSFEKAPGSSFYRVEGVGPQIHLIVNKDHAFFSDVYMGPDSTPRLRAALELLLFVLAEAELEANKERQLFYESERVEWSRRFNTVLKLLDQKDSVSDAESAVSEQSEVEAVA
jgi:hypothetical protein